MRRAQRHRRSVVTILDAMADDNLFARFFRNGESWAAWHTFLAVLFGLPLTQQQCALARECTG
jgi:hypothetical protein